jgi:hypothetical protein
MTLSPEALDALRSTYDTQNELPPPEVMRTHIGTLLDSHKALAKWSLQFEALGYRLAVAVGQVGHAGEWSAEDLPDMLSTLIEQRDRARQLLGDAQSTLGHQRRAHESIGTQVVSLRAALEGIALLAGGGAIGDTEATTHLLATIKRAALDVARADI